MKNRTLLILLLGILPGFAAAGNLPDGPYVSTSASTLHEVDPDYAVVKLEFRTVQASGEAARERTDGAQKDLLSLLSGYEDALRDTRLEALNFGREYEYNRQRQKRVEVGFFGRFSFWIEVSDFGRLSELHYELAAMDWNSLGEPEFKMAGTDAARDAARAKALARATAQARALAEAGGSALGDVWGIIFEPMRELADRSPGVSATQMQRVSLSAGFRETEFAIPVASRPVEFEARVGVVYTLQADLDKKPAM